MILRIVTGTVVGAAVLMALGYVYWALILPPNTALIDAADQPALALALRSQLTKAGTYFIPHAAAPSGAHGNGAASHEHILPDLGGVVAMIHYDPQGGNPLSARTYILSFTHFLASTLMASLLLAVALPALKTYPRRAGFVFGLGLFAAFAIRLTDPIWYSLPWDYFLYSLSYLIVGWGLAALAISAVVRPVAKSAGSR